MKTNKIFLKILTIVFFAALIINLPPMVNAEDAPSATAIPDDAIHIQTVAQLVAIGGLGSAGKYYVLDNDINLVNEWVPINDFRGTFDGQGHSINNLYVLKSSNRQYAGLFGQITVSGVEIKNVGININANGITAIDSAGGLIGDAHSRVTVSNCFATGDVTANVCAGGLIGYCYGSYFSIVDPSIRCIVSDCYATGRVTAIGAYDWGYAGGLIGYCYDSVTVSDCYATGDVTAQDIAGGLIGRSGLGCVTVSSYATGDVTATSSADACVGGLMGNGYGCTVSDCYATGRVTTSYSIWAYAGGLIAMCVNDDVTLSNCYATGDVTATSSAGAYVGGLIGNGGNTLCTLSNCYATGDVTATSSAFHAYAGGLIGQGKSVALSACYVTSGVTATASISYGGYAYVGGLIGNSYDGATVTDCYTTGDVVATVFNIDHAYAGGLIGDSNRITVSNCYVIGGVTAISSGSAYAGDLISRSSVSGSVTRCYRLSTQKIAGTQTSRVCDPLTSDEMKRQQSFVNWNFDTVWAINSQINEGYPHLRGTTGTPEESYAVSVSSSYATSTGAGSYKAGGSVTVNAGTRSGYTFSSWTVNEGGITLANSATATFTMPARNVAVTANWTPTSSGGGGDGGSSGGSGGSNGNGGGSAPTPSPLPSPSPTAPVPTNPVPSPTGGGEETTSSLPITTIVIVVVVAVLAIAGICILLLRKRK